MFRYPTSILACTLLCVSLHSQIAAPVSANSDSPSVFGTGDRPSMRYANQLRTENLILTTLGYEAAYDDNPLQVLGNTSASAVQTFSGRLEIQDRNERFQSRVNYQPYYEMFLQNSAANRFNQSLSADFTLPITEVWSARLRDEYSYRSGPYQPLTTASIGSGFVSPGGLNNAIYGPLTRQNQNSARVDALYSPSARGMVDIFGGYDIQSYSQKASAVPVQVPLYNTRGPNGGAVVSWRPTEHSISGVLGMYQRLQQSGSISGADLSWMGIISILPTAGWNPTPHVQLQGFVGPQIRTRPQSSIAGSPSATSTTHADIAWGFTAAAQRNRTSAVLTGSRVLSNGGGTLQFVHNTSSTLLFRQRIAQYWEASGSVGYAYNDVLSDSASQNSYSTVLVNGGLARRIGETWSLHFGYDFTRQMTDTSLPGGLSFHRNRISCGISWAPHAVSITH